MNNSVHTSTSSIAHSTQQAAAEAARPVNPGEAVPETASGKGSHTISVMHRLFQTRMWREYAQAWDGKLTSTGVGREWVEHILRVPRDECLRRAREALSPDWLGTFASSRPLPDIFQNLIVPRQLGTPLSQLSGRLGQPGYAQFCEIAHSWGHN